jgi:hypothetical protein
VTLSAPKHHTAADEEGGEAECAVNKVVLVEHETALFVCDVRSVYPVLKTPKLFQALSVRPPSYQSIHGVEICVYRIHVAFQ